jgi:nesprin-1
MKEALQALIAQFPAAQEQIEAMRAAYETISANSPDAAEKAGMKTALDGATQNLERLKGLAEDRRAQIGESLDSWQRFLQLYRHVMHWAEEKRRMLAEPLTAGSLAEARQKFNVYAMNVASLRSVGKQLSEMGREIERIQQTAASCASLHEKLVDAEGKKTEIEAVLLERHSLLQETVEEWEQCSRKLVDVAGWLEKARAKIGGDAEKRKPLRDQLASREKQIADLAAQKTKISLSLEKLGVHLKAGIGGDPNIEKEGMELQRRLNAFGEELRRSAASLEAAVAQIDKLQEEIQALRNQTISIEQQLRILTNPTTAASGTGRSTDTEIGVS